MIQFDEGLLIGMTIVSLMFLVTVPLISVALAVRKRPISADRRPILESGQSEAERNRAA